MNYPGQGEVRFRREGILSALGFIPTRRDGKQSLMAQHPPTNPGADETFAPDGVDLGLAAFSVPEPVSTAPSKQRLHPLADRFFRPLRLAKFA